METGILKRKKNVFIRAWLDMSKHDEICRKLQDDVLGYQMYLKTLEST